jgi:hypothetical protein
MIANDNVIVHLQDPCRLHSVFVRGVSTLSLTPCVSWVWNTREELATALAVYDRERETAEAVLPWGITKRTSLKRGVNEMSALALFVTFRMKDS